MASVDRVWSRRPGAGFGRGARGRGTRVACRGKVCAFNVARSGRMERE